MKYIVLIITFCSKGKENMIVSNHEMSLKSKNEETYYL